MQGLWWQESDAGPRAGGAACVSQSGMAQELYLQPRSNMRFKAEFEGWG